MGAIDKKSVGDSLFKNFTKQETAQREKPAAREIVAEPALEERHLSKYLTLQRVTVLFDEPQKEGLDLLARKIMRHRSLNSKEKRKKERITANTIVRALVDCLLEKEQNVELPIIYTEAEAKSWVRDLLK